MADSPDVTAAGSSPEGAMKPEDVQAASSPAEGVNAGSPPAGSADRNADRGLENMFRELQRRDQERQKQMDSVLAWIGATAQQRQVQAQAPAQSPSQPQGEPSDEDLWALAQQGDRQAFETYQRRIARREVQQQYGVQSRQNMVLAQLNTLSARYPVLRDPSHPLTQTVHQAYALLVQNGYPAGADTLLEAAKTAIADRPDLVAEVYNQSGTAREQTRQSAATRAQAGVTGSTVRQSTPSAPSPRLTSEEAALAKRMLQLSDKHPEEKTIEQRAKGAKERFLKRQESGESKLGSIGGFPSVIKEMEDL